MEPSSFTPINEPAPAGKETLDKLGMVIEIAKAKGEPDWDDLAQRLGSASGAAVRKAWSNLSKSHVLRRKGEIDPNAPKPAKVTKPKAPRKKAAPKKKAAKKDDIVEDADDEAMDADNEIKEE